MAFFRLTNGIIPQRILAPVSCFICLKRAMPLSSNTGCVRKNVAPASIFFLTLDISTSRFLRVWLIAPPYTIGEFSNWLSFISLIIFIRPTESKLKTALTDCLTIDGIGSPVITRKLFISLRCAPKSCERIAIAFLSRQHICGITAIPVSL